MNKTDFRKQPYVAPRCEVFKTEMEKFICGSATLNPGGSTTQPNYDDKGEHNSGTIYFGDPSTVAPAKHNELWEEDE